MERNKSGGGDGSEDQALGRGRELVEHNEKREPGEPAPLHPGPTTRSETTKVVDMIDRIEEVERKQGKGTKELRMRMTKTEKDIRRRKETEKQKEMMEGWVVKSKRMPSLPEDRATQPYENEIEKKSKIFGGTKKSEKVRREKETEERRKLEGRKRMRERILLMEKKVGGREREYDSGATQFDSGGPGEEVHGGVHAGERG